MKSAEVSAFEWTHSLLLRELQLNLGSGATSLITSPSEMRADNFEHLRSGLQPVELRKGMSLKESSRPIARAVGYRATLFVGGERQ